MKTKQGFQEKHAKIIFSKILEGVQFIHDSDICHLDLTLDNILLDDKYNPIITDFGLSLENIKNKKNEYKLINDDLIRGTEPYICPIMRYGKIIDAGDAAEIKGRMFRECDAATTEAAKEIIGLFDQAKEITEKLNGKIAERNKVLLALSGCTRPKDAAGEPLPPDYFREVVVGPYLKEIKMMQSSNKAGFDSFVRRAEITK